MTAVDGPVTLGALLTLIALGGALNHAWDARHYREKFGLIPAATYTFVLAAGIALIGSNT